MVNKIPPHANPVQYEVFQERARCIILASEWMQQHYFHGMTMDEILPRLHAYIDKHQ
jgi:hypothetical protein